MRPQTWIRTGGLLGCAVFAQWSCAEVLGLADRPIENGTGGTGGETTSGSGGSTTATNTGGAAGAAHCEDGKKNEDETDLDCGGTCVTCSWGKHCSSGEDCKSGLCGAGTCVSSCLDAEQSGNETGKDCGGDCPPCEDGQGCNALEDCVSGVCKEQTCVSYHVWSAAFGGPLEQHPTAVRVDGAGNIVTAGFFAGSASFGAGELVSAGAYDVFLAKLGPDGKHFWSKPFGDALDQKANALAIDGLDNIVVAGNFDGSFSLGGNPLLNGGGTDLFVAKLSPLGNHQWSKKFGGTGPQIANALAIEPGSNAVFLAGGIDGSVDFGGGPMMPIGGIDAYVVRLDVGGAWQWNKRWGDSGSDFASGAAAIPSGGVVVAGSYQQSIDFGSGPIPSAGGYDIFVVSLDASGNVLWAKTFGDGADQLSPQLASDSFGNIYVAGGFPGSIDFGCGTVTSAGDRDIFAAKLDINGECVWSRRFGDELNQFSAYLAVDAAGQVGLTGTFLGTIGVGLDTLSSAGNGDAFILKLNGAGLPIWGRSFGDSQGAETGYGIAFNAENDAVVAGTFLSTIDLGGDQLTSQDSADAFVARLRLP